MKRIAVILVLLLLLVVPAGYSFGFGSPDQDCSKCHTMSIAEAQALLKEVNPNIKVLEVKVSPMKGLWEVALELGSKKLVYVDFSKKLFFSGDMISLSEKRNLTQDRLTELNRVDVALVPLADALVMGSKDAKHKIIVFDDPD